MKHSGHPNKFEFLISVSGMRVTIRNVMLAAAILTAASLLTLIPLVHAAQGDLDPTFGAGGTVTTDFSGQDNSANAIAIQPDGRIVVAGRLANVDGTFDFALARYNTDGSLDATFGTAGRVTTDFAGRSDVANAIAVQPDGRIVVAGTSATIGPTVPPPDSDFALARYNANGSLDNTFGTGGKVMTDVAGTDSGNAALIQTDGKIVVSGVANINSGQFALARYNTNGSLDSTFGTAGKVTTNINNTRAIANAVAVQPDGKLVAAGSTLEPLGFFVIFALARYNSDGSLDSTFGSGGRVITNFFNFDGEEDVVYSLALQPDGKVIAAGEATNNRFGLARYNGDGSLDNTFGSGGKVATQIGSPFTSRAKGVVLQSDGKIVAAGATNMTFFPTNADFALARYNADGTLDSTFGAGGKIITSFGDGVEGANGIALQSDNKIVVAGQSFNAGTGADFALVRYLAAPASTSTISFSASNFDVDEGCVPVTITVLRSGDTSSAASVAFSTLEGTAKQRGDYTINSGVIDFTPGETSRTFRVLISADNFVEGNEGLSVTLNNPTGGAALTTPSIATVTIADVAMPPPITNPLDDAQTFVGQHYHDFLARQADSGGQAYWASQITSCGSDPACVSQRRTEVSAAFFLSTEFQETGYLIFRLYAVPLLQWPSYAEFIRDRNRISPGANREPSTRAFIEQFVTRPDFTARHPVNSSPEEYVYGLSSDCGSPLTQAELDALVRGLSNGTETRGTVLRALVDNSVIRDRWRNRGFVLMQYFGYLRRSPDPGGYTFWLNILDRTNNYHSMVCAFITSGEYQGRFSSVITHSNQECAP
jgi:uncharacterized delta-60 repeat protein